MDKILTKAVWKMRSEDDCQQGKEVNVSLIPTGGGSYQLYVPSKGCRYACIMCNYGFNHPIREKEILRDLDAICNELPDNMKIIILESSGSFLDEAELSTDLQEKIMERVNNTPLPTVQIETHYKTITREKIEKIKTIFPQKKIVFELGLESTNSDVLNIYNKSINLEELLKTIWMCDKNGIEISLNLLVGAPLLTVKEQIQDAVDSVNWILDNCPKSTSIVLFPLNIKDYTLVKHMYNNGRYSIVYDWEFIEVLTRIPQESLDRIYISWWGNRCNEFHGEVAVIKPYHCDDCQNELNTFYKKFVESIGEIQKAELIKKFSSHSCQCKEEWIRLKESQKAPKLSYAERLEEEKERLIKELNL